MSQSIEFQEIKKLLLESTNLKTIISEPQHSIKSLYLYWALDALEDDTTDKSNVFQRNSDLLKSIQQDMRTNKTIDPSLEKYSPGFVLGLFEFTIRSIEADIETYDEYQQLVEILLSWRERGFPNQTIEKHYNETIKAIEEINGWQETKTEEYYPIIFQLINSSRHHRSEKQVLKFMRKRCRKDKMFFYILSGILRTNPPLHNKTRDLCNEKNIDYEELSKKLNLVLKLFSEETSDPKVKKLIELYNQK